MSNKLASRIAKIERHKAGPAAFVVLLPADAYDHGAEHLERVTAEASREHQARTGYLGPVLIGAEECTIEEWTVRYCSLSSDT